jgi:hypothetical protein
MPNLNRLAYGALASEEDSATPCGQDGVAGHPSFLLYMFLIFYYFVFYLFLKVK